MSYRANGTRENGRRAYGIRADVVAPFLVPRLLINICNGKAGFLKKKCTFF